MNVFTFFHLSLGLQLSLHLIYLLFHELKLKLLGICYSWLLLDTNRFFLIVSLTFLPVLTLIFHSRILSWVIFIYIAITWLLFTLFHQEFRLGYYRLGLCLVELIWNNFDEVLDGLSESIIHKSEMPNQVSGLLFRDFISICEDNALIIYLGIGVV